jgi:hypothetical protein
MTDTDGLRQMLDELADQTPEVPAQEWLAGTRHKVRVRRRARWAGAGGAMALALAAAVVAPQVVDRSDSEPKPVEPTPSQPREWTFPKGTEINRVIASRMNEAGSSELEWTTKIRRSTADAAGMQFCRLSRNATSSASEVRAVSTIDGRPVMTSKCRNGDVHAPVGVRMVAANLELMRTYGVERARPFTVSMWLEEAGERVNVSGAEFGFAIHSCGVEAKDGVGCSEIAFPGQRGEAAWGTGGVPAHQREPR